MFVVSESDRAYQQAAEGSQNFADQQQRGGGKT